MPEATPQQQQDAVLLRNALKFVLSHRREQVGPTNLWRDENGFIVDPPLYVGSILAIMEREVNLEAEHAY